VYAVGIGADTKEPALAKEFFKFMTTPAAANSRMSVGIFCQIFERDALTVANKFTNPRFFSSSIPSLVVDCCV